jgi:hypothetical protein
MKRLTPLVLILLIAFLLKNVSAQTFEIEIGRPDYDEVAHDALQEENGNYVILSQRGDFLTNDYPVIILYRIDSIGFIMDFIEIPVDDEYKLGSAQNVFIDTNNIFVILGYCQYRNSGNYSQYLCRISADFEFIMDTVVGPEDKSDILLDYVLNRQNHFVGVGRVYYEGEDKLLIKEFTTSGDLLRRKDIDWSAYSATSITECTGKNTYHVVTSPSTSAILEIDASTLNLVDTAIFSGSFEAFKILNNPDGIYSVVAGKKNVEFCEKPAFFLCTNDLQLSSTHVYGQPDTNYYYHKNCVDFVSDSIIYLAATHNFTQSPPYLYPERRWIFMNKLKTDGTIIWQRFYKGELNYMPYKVLATSDGGALILSHKYDWNSPYPNQRDIHILKIDSTGWYEGLPPVGTNEYDGMKQILVYPNPTHDVVHFEPGLYHDLELQIFNQIGNLLLKKPLHSHQTVDVSGFKAGVYIYVIQNKTGFLEKGKLVKE